jgi:hypothetical protein
LYVSPLPTKENPGLQRIAQRIFAHKQPGSKAGVPHKKDGSAKPHLQEKISSDYFY